MYGLWTNGPGCERQVVKRAGIGSGTVSRTDFDIPRFGQEESDDKGPRLNDLKPATTESLRWRFKKCHDIIATSGEDKMTAFWELLKVIETKIEDEREDKEFADFYASQSECKTQDGISKIYARINALYKRLFHGKYKGILGESINIKPASLARIVCELQNYSLLETSASVKGAAYEEIVGSNLRGDKGEFFTPRGVIDAAVTMLDIQPEDICKILLAVQADLLFQCLKPGKMPFPKNTASEKVIFQRPFVGNRAFFQ